MHLTRLQLRNFSVHRELDVEFRPGINAIVGPNGSGKSSVLDAIRLAITGVSAGDGKLEDNISWGERSGRVVAEFVHGDSSYTVRRDLRPNKTRFQTPDEGELTKASETARYIERLLGCSIQSLLDNVFVEQGKIDRILFATHTTRLKEIQETIGLSRAAMAEKALAAEISRYNVTIGLKEQVESNAASLRQARDEHKEVAGTLRDLDAEIAALEPSKEVLRRALEARQTNAAIRQVTARLEELTNDHRESEQSYQALVADKVSVEKLVDRLKPLAATARKQLVDYEAFQANAERIQANRLRLDEVETALSELGSPPDDTQLEEQSQRLETVRKALQTRRSQLDGLIERPLLPGEDEARTAVAQAEERLRELSGQGVETTPEETIEYTELQRLERELGEFRDGRCPTCKRPFDNADDIKRRVDDLERRSKAFSDARDQRLADHRTALSEARSVFDEARKHLRTFSQAAEAGLTKAVEKLERTVGEYESGLKTLQLRRQTANDLQKERSFLLRQLTDLQSDAETSDIDVSALNKRIDDFQKAQLRQSEIRSELERCEQGLRKTAAALARAQDDLKELGDLAQMPSDEELAQAEADAQILSTKTQSRASMAEDLVMIEVRVQQYEVALGRLRKQQEEEAREASWVALLKRVREVLHVSGLPSLLMREYGAVLNRRLAYYLRLWEAPFVLRFNSDLDFEATFDDVTARAARLSGGQKMVSAISFLFSKLDTFAREVGLLVLDEPTVYLDQDNITHLQNLLLKLRELAGATGKQVLLVTHEERLRSFVDHVIDITPNNGESST